MQREEWIHVGTAVSADFASAVIPGNEIFYTHGMFSSIQATSAADKSRRGSQFVDVGAASRSGRLAVDLPDVRSRRSVDRNPPRLHGLGDLPDQFDLEQAVVKSRVLDL